MKIAIVHFGRKGAGPAIALEMARALAAQGEKIFYYASSDVENISYVRAEHFEYRFFETYNSKLTYLASVIFKRQINAVLASLRADGPDVVYSPMNDLWAPFIFPKMSGLIRIKTIHDVGIHEGNASLFNKWWNGTNFKDAEKFVILSKKYIPILLNRGISAGAISVIPHAGFDYYVKTGESVRKVGRVDHLLFFGRIDRYKGLNVLLEAFPLVIEKHPYIKLSIVGSGDISRYQKAIDNCRNNIELHNRWIKDNEVAGFVSSCDIVILPYTHATQSGVIPLAYAFSKPVIATNVGCLDEQVVEGKTGLLCEGGNSRVLAEKINYLLDHPDMVANMGSYANDYMKTYLTWDASASLLINFILKG